MKKLKKIAALAVAVVTLVAASITASAGLNFPKAYWIEVESHKGDINTTYYLADNTSHYHSLVNGYDKNMITFSSVDKNLMEGNIVFSVDFANPYAESKRDPITLEDYEMADYMDGLYLIDANRKFITEGKYPLTVNYNAPKTYVNVMVDTNWRVFNNFDLTKVYYFIDDGETDTFLLHFKIKDLHVLPSYNIILEEITDSPNPAKFTSEFYQNHCDFSRKDGSAYTEGSVTVAIPPKYRDKSFNAYINGMKVGKVTTTHLSTVNGSFTNY